MSSRQHHFAAPGTSWPMIVRRSVVLPTPVAAKEQQTLPVLDAERYAAQRLGRAIEHRRHC